MPATFASKLTGRPKAPAAMRLPPGLTVIVAPLTMRTTAHGSIVSGAEMPMSKGTMCGLPASVQVCAVVTLPRFVPVPVGATQVDGTTAGPHVMLALAMSAAATVPLPAATTQV